MILSQIIYDRKTKWIFFLIGGASTIVFYQLTNRFPLFEPRELPFSAIDEIMPFWPWTVWIYFTEYLIFLFAYFGLRRKEHVTRYWYSYMFILGFSVIVFILYPVKFPREEFPVNGVGVSESALLFLRTYLDGPANCLPSLHVSSCYISAFCFWQESKSKAFWYGLWATLVAISTMTTKQHYFVDVWTGILITLVVYWVFFYRVELSGSMRPAGARL